MVNVQVRKQQMRYAVERGVSQRRACTLMHMSRAMLTYEHRMPVKDAGASLRMKELSAQYPQYGYRRIRIFLGRDGFEMSVSRAWRLWNAHGLQLPRRRPRKRATTGRPRPLAPTRANQVWSYDYVFDACANGQPLKCLTLIDEFTK
jgi:putative transposase